MAHMGRCECRPASNRCTPTGSCCGSAATNVLLDILEADGEPGSQIVVARLAFTTDAFHRFVDGLA
jgi:hypothetical protein